MNKHKKSQQQIKEQKEEMEITEKQAIKLAEIGAQLRQKRLNQSMTLQEIAVHTMIRVPILHAIEEAKLKQLPEPIYLQGLLLRYANALGFDGRAIALDFPVYKKKFNFKKFWFNLPVYLPLLKFKPLHLYFIYIFAILLAVQALSQHLNLAAIQTAKEETDNKANVIAATNQAGSTKIAPQNSSQYNPVAATQAGDNKRVRVGLTLKDSSWVLIEADGKTEFEGTLTSGTERTWEANEKLVVLAGNAGGVLLAVNNGQAEQMGAPGEVIEREVLLSRP